MPTWHPKPSQKQRHVLGLFKVSSKFSPANIQIPEWRPRYLFGYLFHENVLQVRSLCYDPATNYQLHWSLLIRYLDDDQVPHFIHLDSEFDSGHYDAIKEVISDSYLATEDWSGIIHRQRAIEQDNLWDCAICMCLHAYVWLFHHDPLTIDWRKLIAAIPDIVATFRQYMAASCVNGKMMNIFTDPAISRALDDSAAASRPPRQQNIIDLLTPSSDDSDSSTSHPVGRRSGRRRSTKANSRRQAKRRRIQELSQEKEDSDSN